MEIIQQILFVLIFLFIGFLIRKRILSIKNAINLGRKLERTDKPNERFGIMLRVAFGQKKMFERPVVGFLHLVVYLGFLLVNIEVLEIVIDGILGTHRFFMPFFGDFYPIFISFFEFVAVAVLLTCVVFLIRRNLVKVNRLQSERFLELKGFPVLDANLILVFEITLMILLLLMNASDSVLSHRALGHFFPPESYACSKHLIPMLDFFSDFQLLVFERFAWWAHIIGILLFALYVTYSKHLHIFLAFPNTYFSDLKSRGEMENMPQVGNEVQILLGLKTPDEAQNAEIGRFGAKDIQDLTWKNLMDAYACTECGRCTSQCPANITGKLLSPRKIMMDTRDRLEDVAANMAKNDGIFVDDGKSLYGDYIKAEELRACTTCNACVQECPILISPLDIILQLRRYQIMEESDAPASWNAMFSNLENNQAPWKFAPSDRFNWVENLNNK